MAKEIESKFVCSAETFQALKEAYPNGSPIEMETSYYDTFDGKLNNLQWTLRRRLENGVSVCTLKTPADKSNPMIRNEWELECESLMQAIPQLVKLGAPVELMEFTVGGLMLVCGAKFTRLAQKIEVEGGMVELALDQGVLIGGHLTEPLQEVEVELARGQMAQVGPYSVVLSNMYEGRGANFDYIEAELQVSKDGKVVSVLAPQRRLYDKWQRSAFSEATTHPSLGSEFYATLLGVSGDSAVLRMSSNPLVNWLWIGGALMSLAPFIGLTRKRRPKSDNATEAA